jgi:hypothetical protein
MRKSWTDLVNALEGARQPLEEVPTTADDRISLN